LASVPYRAYESYPRGGRSALEQLPTRLAEGAAASNRQLVPRLRGGLKLQSRIYLQGGEPRLELTGSQDDITIDGKVHVTDGESVALAQLDLAVGDHRIEIGGFDLPFHTVRSLQPAQARPSLGRDSVGVVVALDQSRNLVTGARMFPRSRPPAHRGLIPHVDRYVKLGVPGEIGTVDGPLVAGWATAIGLPHVAVEIHARSTHPDGARLIKAPRWVAWSTREDAWVIAEVRWASADRDEDAPFNPRAWTRMCEDIGDQPVVWSPRGQPEDTEAVLDRWRSYCSSAVGE
jgi:hypothetical protein